jgi:hypothetical protein
VNDQPIFLSASVPERELDKYIPDPVAIRDAVRALVAETVRTRLLVFGGHPAISPLVHLAAEDLGAVDNVRIYQSEFFRAMIPPVAQKFPHLIWTPAVGNDRKLSLIEMRKQMIDSEPFAAGVFIGGMDGVEDEWLMFTQRWPKVPVYPIASTEGAARLLWNNWQPPSLPNVSPQQLKVRLAQDLDYRSLFHDLLG